MGKYDNIILAGDLNIDELRPCSDSSKNHMIWKIYLAWQNLLKNQPVSNRRIVLFLTWY